MVFLVFGWYALSWAATLNYIARSTSLECGRNTGRSGRQATSLEYGRNTGRPSRQAIVVSFPVMQARQRPSKAQPQVAEIVSFNAIRCRMKRQRL